MRRSREQAEGRGSQTARARSCLVGWAALLLLCSTASIVAEDEGQPPKIPIDKSGSRPPRVEAYINDSFEASDAVARGIKLAEAGRWQEAAELLQTTSDAYGDRLVRISSGYYVGIRGRIADIICAWPGRGLTVYRDLYEGDMNGALDQALGSRSVDKLLRLFDRYFCTAAAAKLADTIGQLAIESGDFSLAQRVYQRVLDDHPDRSTYARKYRAMLVVLSAMGGNGDCKLSPNEVEEKIRWRGSDRLLSEIVDELGESFTVSRTKASGDDWPIFGGDAERNRRSPSAIDELGLLWRSGLFTSPGQEIETEDDSFDDPLRRRSRSRNPVSHLTVSGKLAFVQRSRQIVAIRCTTGGVAWRYNADQTPPIGYADLEESVPAFDAVTVHDGRVFAALPGDVAPYYGFESVQRPPELVCLDAETGHVIWRCDRRTLTTQPSELSFDSTPAVSHGRLYVVGRRRRSFGFEDCYLYCLGASDGRMLFRTHLASASTGTFGAHTPTMAAVTLHGDTAYVCTNLGAVAAVSGRTGAVRWLRLYDRAIDADRHGSTWRSRDRDPRSFNPVLFSNERVLCLPTDSSSLFVYAADDGHLLHSVPIDEFAGVQLLLGVEDDLVCGVGAATACYDLSEETLHWSEHLAEDDTLYGRGMWGRDQLFVPTSNGLSRFHIVDGARSDNVWDAGERGGNVLALPDQLFVVGHDSVSAYVRKAELWNTLRARVAAAPSDPTPALELAEVALRGGDIKEAFGVLDEAVRRVGGFLDTIEAPLRRRFFDDALMFADMLSARSQLTDAELEKLFTYASRSAPDTAAHLQYRFRFAELFEKHDQPQPALRLYHQVLRDRSLRELPMNQTGTVGDTGGSAARARIARLIETHGASTYSAYEAEARRWLDTGRQSNDAVLLARVVATFPNSQAAPLACVEHGELLARSGRADEAARLFTKAYHRYPKHVDRPRLIRKIADAYEHAGKQEHAYRWLTKGAREHPSVTIDYQGRSVGFREYRERLAGVQAKVEPSRPRIVLPLDRRFTHELEGAVSLLVPRFGDDPSCRWSRYLVYADEAVQVFDARTNEALWTQQAAVRGIPELLIVTDELAVFATLYEVFALDLATGSRRWSYGDYPADVDDVVGDWEDGDRYRTHALRGGRLVSVRHSGEMSCVAITGGELLWSASHRPAPGGRVRISELWMVYHVVQDGKAVLCKIDASTGARIDATLTQETRPVVDLFLSLDGHAVAVTTQSLVSYDLQTHAKRWKVRIQGHVRPGSLLSDVDSIYVSGDGRTLLKISLEDGRVLWESVKLTRRHGEDLAVQRQAGSVIVTTSTSVAAVDEVTGLTLWEGATPEAVRFAVGMITDAYVVAVDVPDDLGDGDSTAYFYDHRNASGVIPRKGGARVLGPLPDRRAILAIDGALLVQTGSKILGWTHE